MAKYRIYPPIGFARVGGSTAGFILAREQIGKRAVEFDAMGHEGEVQDYKTDVSHIKPVASRFRVFEIPDGGGTPAVLDTSSGVHVEWTVEVANRKNGVTRLGPPSSGTLPVNSPTGGSKRIMPGPINIAGASAGPVGLTGGSFEGVPVALGHLRTDKDQNLMVIGAQGISESPSGVGISNFYNNPSWYDDCCDGVVSARISLADGTVSTDVDPAWVVSGPPDFAPDIEGLVTLYDIMRQASGIPLGGVSFSRDIYPIIRRASGLKWVNANPVWSNISNDWNALSDPGVGSAGLRSQTRQQIVSGAATLNDFNLTSIQKDILNAFASGAFVNDWVGPPISGGISAEELTRCALDTTVGQGFYPGIEAGIITTNSAIYSIPFDFRLNHAVVKPGDLTALMAVPWQADFFACGSDWWPSQRPNDVLDGPDGLIDDWSRGVFSGNDLVSKFNRLGIIQPQVAASGDIVFAERERDASL